jgi:MFS family permease
MLMRRPTATKPLRASSEGRRTSGVDILFMNVIAERNSFEYQISIDFNGHHFVSSHSFTECKTPCQTPHPHERQPRHPWALLLCAGLILGLSLGVRHAQGIFMLPMTLERGWSREDFALALALQNLVWGLAQPLAGLWSDRRGSRTVLVGGLLLYGLGLWGMTQAHSPWALWLSAGLGVGLGLAGTAFGAVYGALSRLLPAARRSAGLGLAGAIGGLGQFVLVPLAQGLIEATGWAGALLALAALCALGLACVRPIQDTPAPTQAGQPRRARPWPRRPRCAASGCSTRAFWSAAFNWPSSPRTCQPICWTRAWARPRRCVAWP